MKNTLEKLLENHCSFGTIAPWIYEILLFPVWLGYKLIHIIFQPWRNLNATSNTLLIHKLIQKRKMFKLLYDLDIPHLDTQLDLFPENLNVVSNEHVGRFHHIISSMKQRYQGMRSSSMLADSYWALKKEIPRAKYTRKSSYVLQKKKKN
jgi:hypothetical protein